MSAPENYCPGCNDTCCRCDEYEAIAEAEYEAEMEKMERFHGLEDLQPVVEPMSLDEYEAREEAHATTVMEIGEVKQVQEWTAIERKEQCVVR